MSTPPLKEVIVIGAGVIGLTTALKIHEKGGYRVTVIADKLHGDPKSVQYNTYWAGAHHISVAGDDLRQRKMDKETFDEMWKMSAPGEPTEECFLRLPQEEYYCEEDYAQSGPFNEWPDFRLIAKENIVQEKAVRGVGFTTLDVDTPVFMTYLVNRLHELGVRIIRGTVQHINQIVEGGVYPWTREGSPKTPDAIICCPGMGARTLGGVEDKELYPVRGQTVLLRAPWVRFGMGMSRSDRNGNGFWTYIIPRRSGDVIVGGTKDVNDWYPCPRPEQTRDVLERVLELSPLMAPPEVRAVRKPTVEDLLPMIIEEGCGFRPVRKDGVRLEVQWFESKTKKVPVVHNYGHGGYGFICCYGAASIALELLEGALAK